MLTYLLKVNKIKGLHGSGWLRLMEYGRGV